MPSSKAHTTAVGLAHCSGTGTSMEEGSTTGWVGAASSIGAEGGRTPLSFHARVALSKIQSPRRRDPRDRRPASCCTAARRKTYHPRLFYLPVVQIRRGGSDIYSTWRTISQRSKSAHGCGDYYCMYTPICLYIIYTLHWGPWLPQPLRRAALQAR